MNGAVHVPLCEAHPAFAAPGLLLPQPTRHLATHAFMGFMGFMDFMDFMDFMGFMGLMALGS